MFGYFSQPQIPTKEELEQHLNSFAQSSDEFIQKYREIVNQYDDDKSYWWDLAKQLVKTSTELSNSIDHIQNELDAIARIESGNNAKAQREIEWKNKRQLEDLDDWA